MKKSVPHMAEFRSFLNTLRSFRLEHNEAPRSIQRGVAQRLGPILKEQYEDLVERGVIADTVNDGMPDPPGIDRSDDRYWTNEFVLTAISKAFRNYDYIFLD